MRALTPSDTLELWEKGCGLHPIDRALLILARACPEYPLEALSRLGLGRRDALLLRVRALTFGDSLEACTGCPKCSELLEISCSSRSLLVDAKPAPAEPDPVIVEGRVFRLRCPDSEDAAAAATAPNLSAAEQILFERCITPAEGWNEFTCAADLPESIRSSLADALAARDPQAEVSLDLQCPACAHRWEGLFDVVSFLWAEIRVRARRLLQEVDRLARTYGWSEEDILSMSDTRRALYLQMALA